MKEAKIIIPIEYDEKQLDLDKVINILFHSTLEEVLSTVQFNVGDGEAILFGVLEGEDSENIKNG